MKQTNNCILWFVTTFNKCRISVHAAQVAFFIMVSLFPFLMFLITMLGYTPINQTVLEATIYKLIPGSLSQLVTGWLKESYHASGTVLSLSAISALWAGSKGFNSISYELEEIYEIENRRNFFARRIHSILDTILFSVMIVVSLTLLVYGNQIIQLIIHFFPSITHIETLLFLARSGLALFLFVIYFTLMYYFIPKRHGRIRDEIPGAIFSSVLWITFSYLYSIYVDTKHTFGSVYGSLTSIVLLMLWLYFCIIFVFSGAMLNQYLRHHKRLSLLSSLRQFPVMLLSSLQNKK